MRTWMMCSAAAIALGTLSGCAGMMDSMRPSSASPGAGGSASSASATAQRGDTRAADLRGATRDPGHNGRAGMDERQPQAAGAPGTTGALGNHGAGGQPHAGSGS